MRDLRDSQLIAKVEESTKALIDLLNRGCSGIELTNVASISDHVEHLVSAHLVKTVSDNAPTLLSLKQSADGLHLLDRRGRLHHLFCACDVRHPSRLVLHLAPVDGTCVGFREFGIDVGGYGKYREVIVVYPAELAFQLRYSFLYYWCKAIVESGYWWFFEQASRVSNDLLADLALRLYSYARTYVHSDALRSHLWFSAIWEGVGFRLIDEQVARQAFLSIAEQNRGEPYSTSRYVAELLATQLPERMMLMRTAIDGGECVDVDTREAQYKKDGSIYALTMAMLYGSYRFSVYPVFKSDRLSVGCVFDTRYRYELQPILDVHQERLAEICRSYSGRRFGGKVRRLGPLLDALELKPSVAGLGIDLRKLMEFFRSS